jgi:hypothetical protein
LATLFNSVNYYDFNLDNVLSSSSNTNDMFKGTINYFYSPKDENKINDWKGYEFKRTIYPELIYFSYTIISCLIIFGSYFKFKKNLTKK